MIANFCDLCLRRRQRDFTVASDAEFEAWALRDMDPSFICPCCLGLLQFGKPIVDSLRAKFDELNYTDIFSCPLSVQLPALMVFRNFVEKVAFTSTNPEIRFVDVREVLRNLITRSVLTENPSDEMPKLFLEVKIVESAPDWVLPDEVVKAINIAESDRGSRWKRVKTKFTANIADVQKYIESTTGDLSKVFDSLMPAEASVTDKAQSLIDSFITAQPPVPTVKVCLKRETLYLVGKYVKDTREFGQSAWDSNATSVAETICPIVCQLFRSPVDKCLFSASGREDMDVRMLAPGRTFILQLGDARSLEPLLEKSILSDLRIDTGDVKVESGLKFVDKGVMDWLHWSTEQHRKTYRCIVWTHQVLPSQAGLNRMTETKKDIKIYQKTPLRVLHRRAEHTREKYIHRIEFERLNDHFVLVTLQASAGAYIKEFVHGDLLRTEGCFSNLVFGANWCRCDILQLDVLEVEQDEEEEYVPLAERD